jgi:hypothetical protein
VGAFAVSTNRVPPVAGRVVVLDVQGPASARSEYAIPRNDPGQPDSELNRNASTVYVPVTFAVNSTISHAF